MFGHLSLGAIAGISNGNSGVIVVSTGGWVEDSENKIQVEYIWYRPFLKDV